MEGEGEAATAWPLAGILCQAPLPEDLHPGEVAEEVAVRLKGSDSFSLSTSASVSRPCRFSLAKRSSASICSRSIFFLADGGFVSRSLRPGTGH